MSRAAVVLALAALLAGCTPAGSVQPGEAGPGIRVARVGDGDTIALVDGSRVRLVQIDATELGEGECYADEAAAELHTLLPVGTVVTLESDPALDDADRYGRLLRYVLRGELNVNLELVRRGAAAPYFRRGERGAYADALEDTAASARAAGRGMWGACAVEWNPERQAEAEFR